MPNCFCIYRLYCSKAISGRLVGWLEISGRPYSKSTCGANNEVCEFNLENVLIITITIPTLPIQWAIVSGAEGTRGPKL